MGDLSTHFLSLCQRTKCFQLPLAPPSISVDEIPNFHERILTGEEYAIYSIRTTSNYSAEDLRIGISWKGSSLRITL
jgi:hypothetical protein